VSSLRQVNAPIVGAVLNDVSSDAGGYGYGYAPDRAPAANGSDSRRRDPATPQR
jgi:hypothetical protein